jgi:hypothetical protein
MEDIYFVDRFQGPAPRVKHRTAGREAVSEVKKTLCDKN